MYVVGRTDKEVACNGIDRDIVDVGDFGAVADEVVRYQSLLQAVVNGQLVWFAICAGNDVGPVVADHESLWPCNIGDGLGNGAAVAYHLEGCRFVYIVARDGEVDIPLAVGGDRSRVGAYRDLLLLGKTGKADYREGVVVTVLPVQTSRIGHVDPVVGHGDPLRVESHRHRSVDRQAGRVDPGDRIVE